MKKHIKTNKLHKESQHKDNGYIGKMKEKRVY